MKKNLNLEFRILKNVFEKTRKNKKTKQEPLCAAVERHHKATSELHYSKKPVMTYLCHS